MIKQIVDLLAPRKPAASRQLAVARPAAVPARILPPEPSAPAGPTVFGHYRYSFKERLHLHIERQTTEALLPTLRLLTEQARLATEYQHSLTALSLAELEREVLFAEMQQRKLELAIRRQQTEELAYMQLERQRLSLQLEKAKVDREMRELQKPAEAKLTPAQQRLIKKTEIEEQLQQLQAEERRAVQRAGSELEKRRLQNIYTNRRERLMEELEKYV